MITESKADMLGAEVLTNLLEEKELETIDMSIPTTCKNLFKRLAARLISFFYIDFKILMFMILLFCRGKRFL